MTTNPEKPFAWLLDQATNIYNDSPQLHGYSPSFLAFGCEQWHPGSGGIKAARDRINVLDEHDDHPQVTDVEERAAAMISAELSSKRVTTTTEKTHRDAVCSLRMEESSLIHHFSPGDLVLRARIR